MKECGDLNITKKETDFLITQLRKLKIDMRHINALKNIFIHSQTTSEGYIEKEAYI
jgi:hypothetical protein